MMKSAARFSSTTWRSLCWTSIKISKVTDLDLDLDPDPDLDFLRSRPSSVVHRFNNNDKITIRRFLRSNRRLVINNLQLMLTAVYERDGRSWKEKCGGGITMSLLNS
ncbi:uncharacterized protein LOC114262743 isoform X2 [Camellia sinensis]|uniref:uncharacterized protein LOC114262743 isoform X2 n=1 Tax=Camellia sinensis TaxID=4442 RepID=UPI001035FA9C|nr:uncharacterized protein LOC114262743 isoform X2 [Camellia sinensis]